MEIFQILTHFIIYYLKITFINISTQFIRMYWEALKLTVENISYPKFYFFLENFSFIIGNNNTDIGNINTDRLNF